MPRALLIPELAQRDRFLRAVAGRARAYAVAEGERLATVESPRMPGQRVALLWSSRKEAERWADVVSTSPNIVTLALGTLVARTLPDLARAGTLAGIDWSADPVEPEMACADLASRLSIEAADGFLARLKDSGTLWVLENAEGPALIGSPRTRGSEPHTKAAKTVLPCWTGREDAERHAGSPWTGAAAMPIPQLSFIRLTLPWLIEQGWLVAAATADEPHGLEMAPDKLLARLAGALQQAAE